RRVESFGCGKDVPELGIVKILALGMRVDDRALQPELSNSAFQFRRGSAWILGRYSRQAGVAIGASRDGCSQLVVRVARKPNGLIGVENLHARRRQRQDLKVDARGVHVRDAARAEILQAFGNRTRAFTGAVEVVAHEAVEANVGRAVASEQVAIGLN